MSESMEKALHEGRWSRLEFFSLGKVEKNTIQTHKMRKSIEEVNKN